MKKLGMAIAWVALTGCGGTWSGEYIQLKDGSYFRGHTITSHDVSAPTLTTVLLETCGESVASQTREHTTQTEHLPDDKKSGYVRRDTVETTESVKGIECDIAPVGQRGGPSRMRVVTSPVETVIGGAAFVAGMHMLEPNKYNSNTSLSGGNTSSTGGGANATGTGGTAASTTGETTQTTTATSSASTGSVTSMGGSSTSSSQSDSSSSAEGGSTIDAPTTVSNDPIINN